MLSIRMGSLPVGRGESSLYEGVPKLILRRGSWRGTLTLKLDAQCPAPRQVPRLHMRLDKSSLGEETKRMKEIERESKRIERELTKLRLLAVLRRA